MIIAEVEVVSEEQREHYLYGFLSYWDRYHVTEWHEAHLQPHPGDSIKGLWNVRDIYLPRILKDIDRYKEYPEFQQRMYEKVKCLLLDAASRLDSQYTKGKLRKTVKKYDYFPKPTSPRTEVYIPADKEIKYAFFEFRWGALRPRNIADILICAAWGIFSPEAEKFIAYHLWLMAEAIELEKE